MSNFNMSSLINGNDGRPFIQEVLLVSALPSFPDHQQSKPCLQILSPWRIDGENRNILETVVMWSHIFDKPIMNIRFSTGTVHEDLWYSTKDMNTVELNVHVKFDKDHSFRPYSIAVIRIGIDSLFDTY